MAKQVRKHAVVVADLNLFTSNLRIKIKSCINLFLMLGYTYDNVVQLSGIDHNISH